MYKMKCLLYAFVILAMLLTACQTAPVEVEPDYIYSVEQQDPQPTLEPELSEPYQPPEPELPEPYQQVFENEAADLQEIYEQITFDSVLARFNEDKIVRSHFSLEPTANIELLDEWVENYRQGIPGKVVILLDAGPFTSRLLILENDGSATYSITQYSGELESNESISPPQLLESSLVIRRYYDYVFGADLDLPASFGVIDARNRAIVVQRYRSYWPDDVEVLDWDIARGAGVNPEAARMHAMEMQERLSRFTSVTQGLSIMGVYMLQSVLDAAVDVERPTLYFRTVGTMRMGENIYYVVYGNSDFDALNRGHHGGIIYAVSSDLRLTFLQSMVNFDWIFIDDAQQKIIAP